MTHHLVGAAEVARLLGVSRQRVNEIIRTAADFPAPTAELSAGRIWARADVDTWMRNHRQGQGGATVTRVSGVVVVEPREFGDVKAISDPYRQDEPVLVDLRQLDVLLARRIFDFCIGLTTGLEGTAETFATRVVLLSPPRGAVDELRRRSLSLYLNGEPDG